MAYLMPGRKQPIAPGTPGGAPLELVQHLMASAAALHVDAHLLLALGAAAEAVAPDFLFPRT
jgi:hypothetical protein